jgi:tricorn protease
VAGAGGPVAVVIELEGLVDRVVDLPVAAGRLTDLRATAGGLVWRSLPPEGNLGVGRTDPDAQPAKAKLEHLDLATGKVVTLVDGADGVEVTAGGAALVVSKDGGLRLVPADRPATPDGDDAFDVDLQRILLTVDPAEEWPQMYEESARLMKERYWVEDMAGIDWDAVVARYRPIADRISSRDELHDLLWELFGETGTSHAYVWSGPERPPANQRVGHLGADIEPGPDGWRVASVPATEPSVPLARSPLQAALVGVGDVIDTIDGCPVDPLTGPGPLLVGAAGRVVELGVRREGGERRTVAVVPLEDERPLRADAWVAGRRAAVRERSDGRLGYVHVPDMMSEGWAELNRDLLVETSFDGLVADFRHNRGGHTSQLVLERLSGVVSAWSNPRGFEAESYPTDAPRGPLVALCNQYAGSDGDIVSEGFRHRGLGPLVGTRTWGGVIGIDMRYGLADGTVVTQPSYSFWFVDEGWEVENHGVSPDVEVQIAPQDWAAGRDPQIEVAVDLALAALEERPPARPPRRDDRPSRAAPELPPRP